MRYTCRRLIPRGWTVFGGSLYMLSYGLDLLCVRLGLAVPAQAFLVRLLLLLLFAGFYAFYRTVSFHPMYNKRYRELLMVAPWTCDKPFPLGPPQIVWVDVVVVAILVLLAYTNGLVSPLCPAIAFMVVYIVLSGVALGSVREYSSYTGVAFFFLPFAVFPHRDPRVALAVLIGIYSWLYIGFRRMFGGFPWNTSYWKSDPVRELRKRFRKKELVGWLNQMLKLYDPGDTVTFAAALGVAALVTWWLHVIFWLVQNREDIEGFASFIVAFGILILINARIVVYLSPGYRAPMSLWGRLLTVRWIIPRYDRVYFAPVCMAGVLVMMLAFGRCLGLPPLYRCELLVFLEVLLALSLPPHLVDWRLTGGHRMVERPKRYRQQIRITLKEY